jgi:hypothetical protein
MSSSASRSIRARIGAGVELAQAGAGVGDHRGQGLADFVGDAGRQLAEDARARRLRQLRLRAVQVVLGLAERRDVPHDGHDRLGIAAHQPGFVVALAAGHRQRVLDDDRLVGLERALEVALEGIGQIGREDVADALAEEGLRRDEEVGRGAGVIVQIDAVAAHDEHQIRDHAQQCRRLGLAPPQGRSARRRWRRWANIHARAVGTAMTATRPAITVGANTGRRSVASRAPASRPAAARCALRIRSPAAGAAIVRGIDGAAGSMPEDSRTGSDGKRVAQEVPECFWPPCDFASSHTSVAKPSARSTRRSSGCGWRPGAIAAA